MTTKKLKIIVEYKENFDTTEGWADHTILETKKTVTEIITNIDSISIDDLRYNGEGHEFLEFRNVTDNKKHMVAIKDTNFKKIKSIKLELYDDNI